MPRTTYFTQALVNDEEYAALVAQNYQPDSGSWSPPIVTWTQEASLLATVIDKLAGIQHTLAVVNSAKGKAPRPPAPYPIPKTALSSALARAEYDRKKAKHKAIVARVLPHRASDA